MAKGSTQWQERVSVIVKFNGETYSQIFQTFSGGAIAGTSVKNRQGGMGEEEALPSPASREPATIAKIFDFEEDLPWFKWLDNVVRQGGGQVSIGRQKLLPSRKAYGNPINYTGRLLKATPPDSDSNATGEKAEFTLEVDLDEAIN